MTSLAPAVAEPLLRGRFGRPYLYAEQTETTQRMLDADQPEGAVAVAEEQTEGRGRMGRRWEAPAGSSLLVSTLLRPPPERRAAELTLVAGVASRSWSSRATGLAAQIKWPNDVMLNRRKVAGVLAELKDGAVVLGIGINVNQRPGELPAETKVAAGSLYSVTGRESERGELLADLLLRARAPLRRVARGRARCAVRGPRRPRLPPRPPRLVRRGRRHGADDHARRPARGRRRAQAWSRSRAARSCSSADSSAGVFTFASRRGSASSDARIDSAQRPVVRGEPPLELRQISLRVGARQRPGLRDRALLAQLAQQRRRDERAVDREEDRGLGRGGTEPGDDADERRLRLGRLDDDGKRELELALPDRQPCLERLAENPPGPLGERLATERRERLGRAEAGRGAADEQHARRRGHARFSQTETCFSLSLVKGSRAQPAQRSRSDMPASRAIRSSSDGQT